MEDLFDNRLSAVAPPQIPLGAYRPSRHPLADGKRACCPSKRIPPRLSTLRASVPVFLAPQFWFFFHSHCNGSCCDFVCYWLLCVWNGLVYVKDFPAPFLSLHKARSKGYGRAGGGVARAREKHRHERLTRSCKCGHGGNKNIKQTSTFKLTKV